MIYFIFLSFLLRIIFIFIIADAVMFSMVVAFDKGGDIAALYAYAVTILLSENVFSLERLRQLTRVPNRGDGVT